MANLLQKLFPYGNIRNIAIYYLLSVVYNAWIMSAVWIFIWSMYMTKTQIGISDSITFAVGFLFELPSGVLADLMGRKKAIVLGNILLTIGNLFIGLSSSFLTITIWYLVWTIGYAFQSGATEALAYDSLKEMGLEKKWGSVVSTSTVIGRVMSLVSASVGGYLFILGFRLPYLVAAGVGVIGIIASLCLHEIKVKKIASWSIKSYLDQIKDGVSILGKPHIFRFALLSLIILSIGYMYNWGILRPLTAARFGYTPTTYAYLLSFVSLAVVLSISIIKRLKHHLSVERQILMTSFIYAVLFTVTGFSHSWIIGGLLMISLAVALTQTDILFSQFINEHTESHHRATTLSAIALFTKMPYVLLALIVARIAENNGLPQYTVIVGSLALLVSIATVISSKKHI